MEWEEEEGRTLVTAIWNVRSWIGWLELLENLAFRRIGPSGIGRFTSATTRRFESITIISLGLTCDPGGSAEVKAHSSSSAACGAGEALNWAAGEALYWATGEALYWNAGGLNWAAGGGLNWGGGVLNLAGGAPGWLLNMSEKQGGFFDGGLGEGEGDTP